MNVFENRVLRRIFEPKRGDEELHNLYCLPDTVRMNKSRLMRSLRTGNQQQN